MLLKVVTCIFLKLISICEIRSAPSHEPLIIRDSTGQKEDKLMNCSAPYKYPNLSDVSFNPHQVDLEDTACLSLFMFNESGLVSRFNISALILSRFILQAQKGYNKVPYHNWLHGFSVLQFSFAMLQSCRLVERDHVSPLEGLALLTAAMCHDLDHPGTNSVYQVEVNNSLAHKYLKQGSILERHHIQVTLNILKNSDSNFINHFNESTQTRFKALISQIILATDLAAHLKLQLEMKKMSSSFNSKKERDRELLRSIIISCGDLSDQGKDWTTSRKSARNIFTEFFKQGDQEKLLGIVPSRIMDRATQVEIPQRQVDFLTHVIIPNFQILNSLYPETRICLNNSLQNLINWKKSIPYFLNQSYIGRSTLDILDDETLDNIFN